MKKIIILLFIFLLSACYDYNEIEDLVIISGILIDYKDNEYKITSQIIENDKDTKVRIIKTDGYSIEECINKISKILNKDVFISHLKVLLLTDNIIINKIDYSDYFLRNTKSKMNFYIYYVDDKYKDEILNIYKNDDISSIYLKDMTEYNNRLFSSSTPLSFLDLVYKNKEYGIDPIYPSISIKENNNEKVLYLDSLIGFKNNKKIVLNEKNGIYYNMLTNNMNKSVINIPCEDNDFTLIINNTKTQFNYNNSFDINIKLDTRISSYNCPYDLDKPSTTDKLSKLTNNYIKKNVNNLLEIIINNDLDFIGIRNYIYKYNNKKIKSLKDLDFNIEINTSITSIGEMRK